MEINEILSIRYDFDKPQKDTCVSSSRITALSYIPYNFWFSVKFSYMMSSTRAKVGFSCTTYFRSIAVLVFCTHYCTKQVVNDQFSPDD